MIPIYEPYKLNESKKYLNEIIDDNWVSFTGKYINLSETKLQDALDIRHVLLTSSGTSATHCLFRAIKWKYPKCNKIYIPNNSFIAVYNTALFEFSKTNIEIIPIDYDTLNFDMKYLDNMEKNAALVLVHNIGNIIPIQNIISKRPDLILVEDNCEGFMGKYDNKYSGTLSLCSSISFFPNKHITSGEGGAFCTNDTELYVYIKKFCRQGITDIRYKYDILGQNYRMSNINASILYSQLNLLDEILRKKSLVFDIYKKYLNTEYIIYQLEKMNTTHSKWMFIIKFKNKIDNIQSMNNFFKQNNIEIRPFFYDYTHNEHIKDLKLIGHKNENGNDNNNNNNNNTTNNYNNNKTTTNTNTNNIIILPSFPNLEEKTIKYIADKVNEFAENLK